MGDVIPYEKDGVFHLWYLFADRMAGADGAPANGMPWHLVTTEDFVTFTDGGEAVPSGERMPRTSTSTPGR
ncbi:hypothetical protein GCM10025863_27620 [Microbacterium suwonense]|uniref:Glycosyl hydrolases family 43 n=1 Tax=Microbacterium suwonense TaxID=683047 RepID=A0ABN6X7P7_9MICO|nr:hypothetical protein GCM10025863_27620 [Microbacterium suwonense]